MENTSAKTVLGGSSLLILTYIVASCISLVLVAERYSVFHLYYAKEMLANAVVGVGLSCAIVPLFVLAFFSGVSR